MLVTQHYRTIESIIGPLVVVEGVHAVRLGERVTLILPDGEQRQGQVIEADSERSIVQVLQTTAGMGRDAVVRFGGETIQIGLTPDLLGRRFNGLGDPIDGLPPVLPHRWSAVAGQPINPVVRECPESFIQTGISAIDGLNTLVRGQKLPLFSTAGLPSREVAAHLLTETRLTGKDEKMVVILAGMGMPYQDVEFYEQLFEEEASLERSVILINRAGDPPLERLATPRIALTIAEYFAFDLDYQVLVILTDMTAYGDALREVAAARNEIPGRRGYPGYLYTDLATLYERAGRIRGKLGSITLIPMITMPDDDITHPIPDMTGYITEGQIVLSRDLHRKGIFPPIDILPSLSRLMELGIGDGKTREDHRELAHQLYAFYAQGVELRRIADIVGEEGLSPSDLLFLNFAKTFENDYLNQGKNSRDIHETLRLGWKLLSAIPRELWTRMRDVMIRKYGADGWKG